MRLKFHHSNGPTCSHEAPASSLLAARPPRPPPAAHRLRAFFHRATAFAGRRPPGETRCRAAAATGAVPNLSASLSKDYAASSKLWASVNTSELQSTGKTQSDRETRRPSVTGKKSGNRGRALPNHHLAVRRNIRNVIQPASPRARAFGQDPLAEATRVAPPCLDPLKLFQTFHIVCLLFAVNGIDRLRATRRTGSPSKCCGDLLQVPIACRTGLNRGDERGWA